MKQLHRNIFTPNCHVIWRETQEILWKAWKCSTKTNHTGTYIKYTNDLKVLKNAEYMKAQKKCDVYLTCKDFAASTEQIRNYQCMTR